MVNLIKCPVCGSKEIDRREVKSLATLTLGQEFAFQEIIYTCQVCGEEGDYSGETDKNYLIAQKHAEAIFIKKCIQYLSDNNINMAHFERVFELPARTLTRWKNGDFSSTALALLRIVITYPWITEIAENKFDLNFSRYTLIKKGVNELEKANTEMADSNKVRFIFEAQKKRVAK